MSVCDHDIDSSYDMCERCLAIVADGNAVLGRFVLLGPGYGLAVDLTGGKVAVYMVQAETVIYGDGGTGDAWVTFDDQLTNAPSVELHPPVLPTGEASTRDLADICELVSEIATDMLPLIRPSLEQGMSTDEVLNELRSWLDEQGLRPFARRVLAATISVVVLAAHAYLNQDGEQ